MFEKMYKNERSIMDRKIMGTKLIYVTILLCIDFVKMTHIIHVIYMIDVICIGGYI